MVRRSERALEYFSNNFNCSQAVLASFGQDFGLSEDDCLKIGCAFGGGMGRQQHTCGAVTGALMVLGLKFGKARYDPEEKKLETYAKTQEFLREFQKEHGSINCRELLNGLNMNDPDDYLKIQELNLFITSCNKYVADAARITEALIS